MTIDKELLISFLNFQDTSHRINNRITSFSVLDIENDTLQRIYNKDVCLDKNKWYVLTNLHSQKKKNTHLFI